MRWLNRRRAAPDAAPRYNHALLIRCLLVLAGGAAGSLTRYLATLAINERYDGRFPLATFLINITGSFIIGLLLVLLDREDLLHPNLRPLLVTGFLGGYTTFSSFEWEVVALGRSAPPIAIAYAFSSVVVGFLACWAGTTLARK